MEEKDAILDQYYQEHIVSALVGIKCDTKNMESIGKQLVNFKNVEDVFLTTGTYDIITKVKFPSYGDLKNFLLREISSLEGVLKTETMLVVHTYKERGVVFE